jgi:hypothetical protein
LIPTRDILPSEVRGTIGGIGDVLGQLQQKGYGVTVCPQYPRVRVCVLGVMRLDTLFQMQLPMQAQSEGGKNPLATTQTANSVGTASVKRRGRVHGLTTVRAAYLLSTK